MRIIRNREIIDSAWRLDPATGDLPPGDVVVGLQRWRAERDALLTRGSRIGILVNGGDGLEGIGDDLEHFGVVAMDFSPFTDGRAFSHARWLRSIYGYTGDVLAVGDYLIDQVAFMERCGINAFHLPDHRLAQALEIFDQISVPFQPAHDGGELVFQRHG